MKKHAFVIAGVLFTGSVLSAAEPTASKADLQSIVRDVLTESGLPMDGTTIAFVNEGTQISINVDMKSSITEPLLAEILRRYQGKDTDVGSVKIELNMHGVAARDERLASTNPHPAAWTDALQTSKDSATGLPKLPQTRSTLARPDVAPEQASANMTPHSILVNHLQGIRRNQQMSNTITEDSYWKVVYASVGHPEMFEAARDEIHTAVKAGLKPYNEGKVLTASTFSDLALEAIAAGPTTAPFVSIPEDQIFQ